MDTPVSNTKYDPATWEIKEIVLVVPAFATALAMVYDVGFFMEIEPSFFSFFSLSEHIVFAIQAIPLVLALILGAFAMFAVSVVAKLITPEQGKVIGKKKGRLWFVLGILLIVLGVIVLGVFVVDVIRRTLESQLYTPLAGGLLFIIIFSSNVFSSNYRAPLVMVMLIAGVLVIALLLGADVSRHEKSKPTNSHQFTIDNAVVEGNLVRSGERGVLFYHATSKQYRLVQWNRITEVRAKAHDENW